MNGNLRKLHLGCGLNTPVPWVNLDASWNAWLTKHRALREALRMLGVLPKKQAAPRWSPDIVIHDVRKPLPFGDNYFIAVYSSHLLEHLYLDEGIYLFKECLRVLKPAGVLRVVVPDLRAIVLQYLRESESRDPGGGSEGADLADRLNRRLALRAEAPLPGGILYRMYSLLKDFHSHKWMYDAESLVYRFQSAGFVRVAERGLHDSEIEDIRTIELPERVIDGAGICVEGAKPPALTGTAVLRGGSERGVAGGTGGGVAAGGFSGQEPGIDGSAQDHN